MTKNLHMHIMRLLCKNLTIDLIFAFLDLCLGQYGFSSMKKYLNTRPLNTTDKEMMELVGFRKP